jgi:hypothetical protein
MLVVTSVLPGSPSENVLQPGDILVKVNGHYVTQFDPLDEMSMIRSGKQVAGGGARRQADFRQAAGGRPARHYAERLRGVWRCGGEHPVVSAGAAVQRAGARGRTSPTRAMCSGRGYPARRCHHDDGFQARRYAEGLRGRHRALGDGDHATVRYITIDDPNGSNLRSVRMDRLWFPARHCERDDNQGVWPCKDLPSGPASKERPVNSTEFPKYKDPRLTALAPSLVSVTFDMPYSVSGITERNYHGTGWSWMRSADSSSSTATPCRCRLGT